MANLLIVEDNTALIRPLVGFLQRQGHHTVTAAVHTGEAALEQLPHLNIDLALVDVSLPNMSGIELVAIVRQQYPELPCVMLSGHNEHEYARRALASGASGYIVKGNPLALLEGIADVLAGKTYLSEELRTRLSNKHIQHHDKYTCAKQ